MSSIGLECYETNQFLLTLREYLALSAVSIQAEIMCEIIWGSFDQPVSCVQMTVTGSRAARTLSLLWLLAILEGSAGLKTPVLRRQF